MNWDYRASDFLRHVPSNFDHDEALENGDETIRPYTFSPINGKVRICNPFAYVDVSDVHGEYVTRMTISILYQSPEIKIKGNTVLQRIQNFFSHMAARVSQHFPITIGWHWHWLNIPFHYRLKEITQEWDRMKPYENIIEKTVATIGLMIYDRRRKPSSDAFKAVVTKAFNACHRLTYEFTKEETPMSTRQQLEQHEFVQEILTFIFGSFDSEFTFDGYFEKFRLFEPTERFSSHTTSGSHAEYLMDYFHKEKKYVPYICHDLILSYPSSHAGFAALSRSFTGNPRTKYF